MDMERSYPYTNGVIKVIESKILDKSKLSKINRDDKSLFIKSLCEMGYGQMEANTTIESLISKELVATKKFIDDMSPQPELTDLFFMANDALNVKFLYKKMKYGITYLDIDAGTGTMSKESLEKAIFESDYSTLKPAYQDLMKDIAAKVQNVPNARLLSATIDNIIYDFVFSHLGFFQNSALKEYFELSIDISNVLSFLRSKALKWDILKFQEVFIPHGLITISVFDNIYDKPENIVIKAFSEFYEEKISRILKTYFEDVDLNVLESMFDELVIKAMKEHRNDSFGIGPVIYYYLEKMSEAKNIRLLYSGVTIKNGQLLDY